jgi:uncharacterized protein (TIGR03067 family)
MNVGACFRWAALCLLTMINQPAGAVDDAAVQKAVARGVDYFKQLQTKEGVWTRQGGGTMGATALAGLALLECGVSGDDAAIQKAAEALREGSIPLTDTYSIALCILFFDRLGESGDVPLIESLTVRLLAGQASDGGWTYECPSINETEVVRLKTLVKGRNANNPSRQAIDRKRTVHDLPPQIQQQVLLAERLRPDPSAVRPSDNSNTQFATLALWVGHRYGLPVEKAVARIEARFRGSQNADGGWGYLASGSVSRTTPAMTCAGLLGLAVTDGIINESIVASSQVDKGLARGRADGASEQPRRSKPRTPRDPERDRSVRAGLLTLGAMIGQPTAPRLGLPQDVPNYYFLWSLERVAVVFGLDTIGHKNWYGWGAEFAVARQQSDGSWNGGYAEAGVDTSFALLFLRRSNLAEDLTASLRGKVQDPGKVALRAGGVGGSALAKKSTTAASGSTTESSGKKNGTDPSPKLETPNQFVPNDTDREAAQLSGRLVRASPAERDSLLEHLKDGKGLVYTQALAAAIPHLTGPSKTKARDALAERLARMTVSTLEDKLRDGSLEIRRAAALACAMRDERKLIPHLIHLLEDPEPPVLRAAHAALKALTREDFGPAPDASRMEQDRAVAAWKSWWKSQGGSLISSARTPRDDPATDREKLQGTWILSGLERSGNAVPKSELAKLRLKVVFSGDLVTFEYADHTEVGIYRLEASQDSKTIDVVTERSTSKGIYRLEGDGLKICGVPNGEERPAELATKPDTKEVLFELKRQKP